MYERDSNQSDEAMFRRYNGWHSRFDQPDPYNGSYSLTDPQSLNRYAYPKNDLVNFRDPTGLTMENPGFIPPWQNGWNQTTNPTETFINGAMRDFVADYKWFAQEETAVYRSTDSRRFRSAAVASTKDRSQHGRRRSLDPALVSRSEKRKSKIA